VTVRCIPRSKIQIVRQLGEGAFGNVYLGTCDLRALTDDVEPALASQSASAVVEVAIKTLKGGSQGRGVGGVLGRTGAEPDAEGLLTAEREFEREAELLTLLRHDNIIRFYGVCDDGQTQQMLILEYMPNGDLNNYLRFVTIFIRQIHNRNVQKKKNRLHIVTTTKITKYIYNEMTHLVHSVYDNIISAKS